jgi:hypothetical protein
MTGHRLTFLSLAAMVPVVLCVAAVALVCGAVNLWSPR